MKVYFRLCSEQHLQFAAPGVPASACGARAGRAHLAGGLAAYTPEIGEISVISVKGVANRSY